jgi:outer membrane receptor protein involved in Fe transport
MKLVWIIILPILLSTHLFAQQSKLEGVLLDSKSKSPIDLATITIKNLMDSSKFFGAKSNEKGQFEIENVPYGNYKLQATSLGYLAKEVAVVAVNNAQVSLGKISLVPNSKVLKDVTVSGEKATIQMTGEKKIFNVDKNITSAGGTAEDVLRNTPSVSVDMDGNVSLRGKDNVMFLVDGKPSAMFGSDVQTALQSIPASSIESIEVITNPSSKYDAQGMSGILNIVLKKDKKPGYNALLNAGIGIPYRLNGGINFNANVKKWNFFINANARTSKTWEETTSRRNNYSDDFTFSSFTHNDRRPLSGFMNMGLDYQLNKKDKISFSQSFFNANMRGDSRNTISNEIGFLTLLSRQVRDNEYTGKPLNSTTNLQFNHKFDKPKEELNVEANFSISRYIRESEIENISYDANLNPTDIYIQRIPIRGGNYNGTLQLDYTKPVLKNARIDAGLRSYFIQFESENQPTRQLLGEAEYAEPILKNHFIFNQQLHAAYGNVANQYGATNVQIGLRAEYFLYKGTIYQYNASASNDYLSLFPTIFMNRKLKENQDVTLNYSRRVNRPNFFQLIPYLDVTNPQDTVVGNPNLQPEFIHSVEIAYNYRYGNGNTLIGSVYYQYTTNLIQRYRRFNQDGTTFSQNQNLANGQTYGVELIDKHNITKMWDLTSTFNFFVNRIDGSNLDSTLKRNGYGGFLKLISNTKFTKTLSAQVVGNFFGTTTIAQGEVEPYANIDFAIRKTFKNNLGSISLNVTDVFNTLQTRTVYNFFGAYNQEVLRKNLTRTIGLNFQWRIASKSMRNPDAKTAESMKRNATKGKSKDKEAKSRDENLKKEDGDSEEGGNNNR